MGPPLENLDWKRWKYAQTWKIVPCADFTDFVSTFEQTIEQSNAIDHTNAATCL
jgi:hypothetical protein